MGWDYPTGAGLLGLLGGPSAFWGPEKASREHLQSVARHAAVSPCEQLDFQHVPRTVELVRPQHVQSDRTRHQISQLQSFGVAFLVSDDDRQGARPCGPVVTVADTAELELELLVFLCTARLAHHGARAIQSRAIRAGPARALFGAQTIATNPGQHCAL